MDTNTSNISPEPKIGVWKGGFLLARASWWTLTLDKEMVLFPILSAVTTMIALGVIGLISVLTGLVNLDQLGNDINTPPNFYSVKGVIFVFISYLVIALVTNFFGASIIASALHRFRGNDPTISYGISEAKKHFGSIFWFSLLSATVGLVIRFLEDKFSWAGKLAAFLSDVAWAIMTLFAIPVIVDSKEPIGPITTIKKSTAVFKKVWGTNFTGNIGMGVVFLLAFLLWLAASAAIVFGLFSIYPLSIVVSVPLVTIAFILFISITSTLSSIFQAALYHYAITGESTLQFDKKLLRAAFKPKKGFFA